MEGVDDLDKLPSFIGDAAPRRSASSLADLFGGIAGALTAVYKRTY